MKHKFLIFLLFLINIEAFSQINIDFENAKIPRSWHFSETGCEIFDEGSKSKKSLIIAGPNAFLESKKLDYPGELGFYYKTKIPALEVGFTLNIEYYSVAKNDWVLLDVIKPTFQQAMFFMKNLKIPEQAQKIRWKIAEYNGGSILIDNIKINPMTSRQIASLEVDKREKEISAKIFEDLKNASKNEEFDKAKNLIKSLEKKYLKNLFHLQKIYDKASGIYITQKTGELIFKRSEMANPLSYDEFKKWVKSLQNLSDNALKSYLTDLEKQFQEQREKFEKHRAGLKKINHGVNLAINLGNLITGGKLSSIINSFKGIFATCYSKSNLSTLFPIYKEEVISIKGREKRKEKQYTIKTLVKNYANIRKIDSLVRSGKEEYQKLSAFFEIIENENTILTNQANLWKVTNNETNAFRREVKNFVKNYIYQVIKDTSLVKIDMIEKFLNEDSKSKNQIVRQINKYFTDFIGEEENFKEYDNSRQEEAERIKYNILKVEQLAGNYYKTANRFLDLYQNMEIDLQRTNPFLHFDMQNKKNYFPKAAKSWEKIRKSAIPVVRELKSEIYKRYVDIDIIAP